MQIDYGKLLEPFDRSDWEWRAERVGVSSGNPWCNVVPYIQNRAIQKRLDDVCGPGNWKNEFREWKGDAQLCGISIYDESKNEWITKWDGADDTNFESTKGGLSASMKRAAVQWGIGRHLYEESGLYVECSLTSVRGWKKAQTKEKQDIWWNPNDPQITGAPPPPPKYTDKQLKETKIPTAAEFQKSIDVGAICREIVSIYGEIDEDFKDKFAKKYGVEYFDAEPEKLQQCLNDMKAKKEKKK
jgi:hypothetical protein